MQAVPVIVFQEHSGGLAPDGIRLHDCIFADRSLPPSASRRLSVLGTHGCGVLNGSFVSSTADAVQALSSVEPMGLADIGEQMTGSLTVYIWDAQANCITILADPLGASLVFMHTDAHGTAISSSIGNLAALRQRQGRPLRKSLAHALTTLVTGGSGGLIPASYEEVDLLDHFQFVEVDTRGVHVRAYRSRESFHHEALSYEDGLGLVEAEVRANARAVGRAPHKRRIAQLTGGMDSRTVLGALLREGEQGSFAFNCMGDPQSADKVAAHGLAAEFDLTMTEYTGLSPYRTPETYNERVLASLRFSEGLQSTPVHRDMRYSQALVLAGGYGELLRSPYRAHEQPLLSTSDARVVGETIWGPVGFSQDSRRLISGELQERYISSIREVALEATSIGLAPDAWQDYYYLRRRNRYFVGEISRQWSTFVARFDPLYSMSAGRTMLRQPWEVRKSGVFLFDLLERLHSALPTLPFDTSRHSDLYLKMRGVPLQKPFRDGISPRYNDWARPLAPNHERAFAVHPTPDQAAHARKLGAPVHQVVLLPTVRAETRAMLAALDPVERRANFNMEAMNLLGNRAERHGWSLRSLFVIHSALLWYIDDRVEADER